MGQGAPDSFFAQPSMGMTSSPTQMNHSDWFDFRVSCHSPTQATTASLASPAHRHTVYSRVGNERPVISPVLPFEPLGSQPQSWDFDTREAKEELWFPGVNNTLVAEQEDEEDISNGIRNPGLIVASRLQAPVDLYGTQIRSFHSLAGDNILTNYSPSPTDTPLNDPQTAAVFWYFVNVTAPALSLFERNPVDPSRMFSGETIPKSHQHIWTYVFPVSSFQHPALLQAILALGSLQMALIKETPFSEMSRQILTIHQQRRTRWAEMQAQNPFGALMPQLDHISHEVAEVDLGLGRRSY
ncbi:hypothetical protein VM1G_03895 [Cytospora mali]|uniref:Transcription factor domain-containing protein n=1 Tax=Cytospora mali TaxID=578113 RepID=A0A194VVI6_CYTMA|nr:hypothetical protein VM1G_03895 [Valsa mali]